MKPPVASYYRRGFTMSRRAYISHKKNEHPVTHWIEMLGLDKKTIKSMLIYAGIHHTGLYAKRTKFYRLPRLKNENEFRKFYKVFHTIPATKKKFIKYMSEHLQEKCMPFHLSPAKENLIRLADLFKTEDKKSRFCAIDRT